MAPRLSLRSTLPAACLLALAPLAGCGGEETPPTASATPAIAEEASFNGADVAFATGMIPHHAQALAMVDLTRGRDLSREVETLAEQIRATQAPEIERMTDWLTEWEQPVPATGRDHVHAGHGDDGGEDSGEELPHADLPGMLTADEMAALEEASDRDFQRLWLELMLEHHEGAVAMAQAEVEDGEHTEAVALARAIVTTQRAEIDRIQQLLG